MLTALTLTDFCDEIASSSPAPGGGSVAALSGALGAALIAMVGNLTLGKKKYAGVEPEMLSLVERGNDMRQKLLRLIDADAEAFNGVMAAMKMPKESEGEKAIRAQTIANATESASQTPMDVIRFSLNALEIAESAATMGNQNSISDAGVGALMLRAACEGAELNVRINLQGLQDAEYVERIRVELNDLMIRVREKAERIREIVAGKIQ